MLVAFTQWKHKSECDTVIKWSVHSALVILDKVSTSTAILTMVLLRSILFSPLLVRVSTSTTILTITLLCWKPALIKDKVYKVESGFTLQAKFVRLSEILSPRQICRVEWDPKLKMKMEYSLSEICYCLMISVIPHALSTPQMSSPVLGIKGCVEILLFLRISSGFICLSIIFKKRVESSILTRDMA